MSRFRAAGWKVTARLTSSFGWRKPLTGLTLKSGARSLGSSLKAEGRSPLFWSMTRRVTFDPSITCPKATWSASSLTSIAMQEPSTRSNGRASEHTCSTTGCEKRGIRASGAKRRSSCTLPRGRTVACVAPSPPKVRATLFARSASAASSAETSTSRRERLTSVMLRVAGCFGRTAPKWTRWSDGSASSKRISQPSPPTRTATTHSPLTRKRRRVSCLPTAAGEKVRETSLCSPGASTARGALAESHGTGSSCSSKLTSCSSLFVSSSDAVCGAIPSLTTKQGPKSRSRVEKASWGRRPRPSTLRR
mmetsp:Transcript_39787/g.118058  ORF Transcript_39787/g.118058 Transcript_39787/m.118058 type:complete len:306 (-) Transcript_39787:7251-8168(-)